MTVVRDLSTSDTYLKNNILKDFCQVEWLREEQRNCIKICSMEDVFAIFYASFGTSLIWWMNLVLTPSPQSWWFSSSQGHNDWTVEQNQSCISRNRYWRIEEASARLYLNTVLDLCTFAVLFLAYWPFALQSFTPLWFAMQCLYFA